MGSTAEATTMRVKELRIYPIKSIRGVSLQSHRASAMGFEYDRIFMLQRVKDDKSMHVPHFPSMCLFTTELSPSTDEADSVLVRYGQDHTFDQPDQKLPREDEVLKIPLQPDISNLKQLEYKLHQTDTKAYVMPDYVCKWFSDRFGFEVRLNYIGINKRQVLGTLNPNAPPVFAGDPDPKTTHMAPDSSWLGGLKAGVGNLLGTVASYGTGDGFKGIDDGLTFADIAAFLVVSWQSYLDVQGRVQADIDIEKFRPNIVVEGAGEAWEEDFWGEIGLGVPGNGNRITFTSNCLRCASVNVDYSTGKMSTGPEGKLLQSMQKDRRVDPGHKYSPAFGRYGFMSQKNGIRPEKPITISVGDEVQVTKKNDRRTHFCKFMIFIIVGLSVFSTTVYLILPILYDRNYASGTAAVPATASMKAHAESSLRRSQSDAPD